MAKCVNGVGDLGATADDSSHRLAFPKAGRREDIFFNEHEESSESLRYKHRTARHDRAPFPKRYNMQPSPRLPSPYTHKSNPVRRSS